ncbi:MAG: hypothetical protein FRX48_09778 [Lasallia pustulata]|uniref:Uncharacterized protein n=1 Tax=Lasallia pustulata TaxID=136370 RepID=A0A5M8PAX1_9LECA|nr:MAG: hypothetical protein FRX48_09778 [Lasallia pustulata]
MLVLRSSGNTSRKHYRHKTLPRKSRARHKDQAENGAMGFDNEAVSTGRSKKASGTRAMEAADQMETQSAKEGATPRSSISGRQSPLTAKSSSGEVPKWGMARNDVGW